VKKGLNGNMNKEIYTDTYDVFISYRREGGETMAILLHDRLTAKGYSVFLDVESLNSGKFNSQLLSVIENCRDVIVVLSENSLDRCVNEDDWVRKELVHAFETGKNIIPFMLRGFKWPENLPRDISELPLQNGVNANSNEYFDASIERLVTKFLSSKPQEPVAVMQEAALVRKSAGRIWADVASFVFLTALIIGGIVILINLGSDEKDDDGGEIINDYIPSIAGAAETPPAILPADTQGYTEEVLDKDYSDSVVNRTISADYHGIAAIKTDGTVISHDMKGDLSGWTDIVSVSVGGSHVLGLKSDGTVVAMGEDDFGQCNVSSWKDIIAIEAGGHFSIGIRRNGTVVTAGFLFQYHSETGALRDVIAVAAGMHHFAALKADGTVEVVGSNSRGEHLTSGWSDIVAVASGDFFTLGLKSDGTVVWAGDHEWKNDWEDYYGEPAPGWCGDIESWRDIKAIAVGRDIIGIKSDGTLMASNGNSMSGIDVISEWRDIVAVAFTWNNIVGLKSDGAVVYTKWMTFDDIVELEEWSGIAN